MGTHIIQIRVDDEEFQKLRDMKGEMTWYEYLCRDIEKRK